MAKMKYLSLLVFLISSTAFSQVGINTTNPKASLDVNSSSQGMLIPRVELVMTTQELPVINPNGGALENSTMVYNTVTVNDVRPGFYYWETNKWVRLNSNSNSAQSFLQFTTFSLPFPTGINDNTDFLLSTTNYDYNVFRILHSGAELSGIAGGVHGKILYLYNGNNEDLKLLSEINSSSLPQNKFSASGDIILRSGNSIIVFYDGLYLNRWIIARSDN
jgi:hypothetical protein